MGLPCRADRRKATTTVDGGNGSEDIHGWIYDYLLQIGAVEGGARANQMEFASERSNDLCAVRRVASAFASSSAMFEQIKAPANVGALAGGKNRVAEAARVHKVKYPAFRG
jgi:hypothetical protein